MLPLEPQRRVWSSTRPVESMHPPWPRYKKIYADASCAPSSLGVCWTAVRPKKCWPTNTVGSQWTQGYASKRTTALRWSGCCATARGRFDKYLGVARLVKDFPPRREASEQGDLLLGLSMRLRREGASAELHLGEAAKFYTTGQLDGTSRPWAGASGVRVKACGAT
jgi:hypothetical protein